MLMLVRELLRAKRGSRPRVDAFAVGPNSVLVRQLQNVNVFAKTDMCRVMSKYGSDKGSGWHNYTTVYSRIFSGRREEPLRIFELGLGTNKPNLPSTMGANGRPGASLRGWRELFPYARIFGADIDCDTLFEEEGIMTFYCDQRDPEAMTALWSQPALTEGMDIIIDDGLHTFEGNSSFLEGSLAHLRPGGFYVIEDILEEMSERWHSRVRDVYSSQFPGHEFVFVSPPNPLNNHRDNNLLIIWKQGVDDAIGREGRGTRGQGAISQRPVGKLRRRAPTERRRIMIASTMSGDPWGGSEDLWSKAAGIMLSEGFEIIVSKKAWPTIPAPLDSLVQAGAVLIPSGEQPSPAKRVFRKIFRVRPPSYEISMIERHAPDILLISLGNNTNGVEWMEGAIAADVPYAIVVQCAVPWGWPGDEVSQRLRAGYLHARKVYFVSNDNLVLTERQLGCNLPNAMVVRNPFKVPYKQEFSWPEEEPARWACVARLEVSAKGHDLLFDVLAQDKWRNRPLQLTLYGKGRNEQILREEHQRRRLINIQFGGYADPTEIWNKQHCLILPSRYEGLPLALVEAMLCGRPCIVTDVSGNKELLEDNITGFVAAAPTVSALDEAMERAWQRRGEWRCMGERAAKSIRKEVPADPGAVFVDEFLTLCRSDGARPKQ